MKKILILLILLTALMPDMRTYAQHTSAQLTDDRTPGSLITPQHWWYVIGGTAIVLGIVWILIRRERMTGRQR